jgi:drug/metabolite transporter (DMT)-like permease
MRFFTYCTLVLTMLFWGGTFIAGRALAGSIPPASSAFLRFAIATVALACITYVVDGRLSLPPRKQWFPLLILGLSGVFCYNMSFFTGLQYIEAGRASLIIALNPLVITLLATLLLGEALSRRQFCGILLSLTGAVFVISNGHPAVLLRGSFGRGELAILGCVASWATYSLVGRTVLKSLTPLASVFYSSLIGTLLLAVPAVAGGILTRIPNLSRMDWLSLAFLGIFGTALGFSFYYRAIQRIGASRSGVFINLVPLFSIVLSWLILGETIRPAVITGGIMLMSGVALTNYRVSKAS